MSNNSLIFLSKQRAASSVLKYLFSKHSTKTHCSLDEIEKNENSTPENIIKEVNTVEENQDVIIDSLFTQVDSVENEVEKETTKSEHVVDPDDFALYKKYLN